MYFGAAACIGIIAVLTALIIAAELYIRTAQQREIEYAGDAFLNYWIKAHQEKFPGKGWFHNDNRTVKINGLGFRGEEISKEKPKDTLRIAVFGGSAVCDIFMPDDDMFTVKLQKNLQEQLGRNVEVINCGVPGWSAVHSLVNYMFRVRYLKPDMIIIYHTWNDIKYFLFLPDGFDMPSYFSPYNEQQEQAHIAGGFPQAHINALKIMLIAAIVKFQGRSVVEQKRNPFNAKTGLSEHIFDATIFKNSLIDCIRLAKADGISVILCMQANLAHAQTSDEDKNKIWYSYISTDHAGLVKAINAANTAIYEISETEHVPVIDVYAEMLGTSEYFLITCI